MDITLIKLIDRYLNNEMSSEESSAFKTRIENEFDLKLEVDRMIEIRYAAKRGVQRMEVLNAGKSYHFFKLVKATSVTVLVIVILAVAGLMVRNIQSKKMKNHVFSIVHKKAFDKQKNMKNVPAEYFKTSGKDTVLLSKSGVLLSVPEAAFLKNGKPYTNPLVLQWQEAIDDPTIVKGRLSTTSGDKLLETQGMFGIKGFDQEGKPLQINPKIGVYVQVPVISKKENMQLFNAIPDKNGKIDWKNPTPLEKIPVLVDITTLDFYPSNYEQLLDESNFNKSKKSRDSLYLSFDKLPKTVSFDEDVSEVESVDFTPKTGLYYNENSYPKRFVKPSEVLAIWTPKFNKTIIATEDFEKRMQAIHNFCAYDAISLYVSMIDAPLWKIDEILAQKYPGFLSLASERIGKINLEDAHFKNMQAFYETTRAELALQSENNANANRKRENEWDKKVTNAKIKDNESTKVRTTQNLQEEQDEDVLLKNVKKQLGIKTVQLSGNTVGFKMTRATNNVYNIDRFVSDVSINRTSRTFVSEEGKTATISYQDFDISIANSANYTEMYVYLFPNEYNSFIRLDPSNGKVNYALNSLLNYNMALVGFNKDGIFWQSFKSVEAKSYGDKKLEKVSLSEFTKKLIDLNDRGGGCVNIAEQVEYINLKSKDIAEQIKREGQKKLREDLITVIFKCTIIEKRSPE
jgi:hypothetical protein